MLQNYKFALLTVHVIFVSSQKSGCPQVRPRSQVVSMKDLNNHVTFFSYSLSSCALIALVFNNPQAIYHVTIFPNKLTS